MLANLNMKGFNGDFIGEWVMRYFVSAVTLLIIAVSIALGGVNKNWFIEFGLFIVVSSTITSMTLAFSNARRATLAEKIEYKSLLPDIDNSQSHSFKFTSGMMGIDIRNPNKHFQDQIDELRRVAHQDEQTFRALNKTANIRIDICLAQIKYHEIVTLPKILSQGSGSIIFAGILTIIGSIFLAIPDIMHARSAIVMNALHNLYLLI